MKRKYHFINNMWMKVVRLGVFVSALVFIALLSRMYSSQVDVIDEVVSHLKSADSKAFAKHFADVVEIDVLSGEKTCPKLEAEHILDDFFSRHQVSSLKIIHRIESKADYKLVIVILNTNKGSFRTTISMKNSGQKFLITEMRIENNKDAVL